MRMFLFAPLLTIVAGCGASWSYQDGDGDGFTIADGDCWDSADGGAAVNPSAAEIWYDGVDQNCDGGSDFDKDGDGFDGGPEGVDCWDDPDDRAVEFTALNGLVQVTAYDVHPGADDAFYDGVDADCAGDGDFDQDGDGYDSATWVQRDATVGDDCLDAETDDYPEVTTCSATDPTLDVFAPEDVNPAATETWYDGTDQNCDGLDDHDADGDTFGVCDECNDADATIYRDDRIPEVWYNGVDENCDGNDGDQDGDGFYVEGYNFELPEGVEATDCWDNPDLTAIPADFVSIGDVQPEASQVFPGATETWYDAVDQDCAEDNDFDQDKDGYTSSTKVTREGTYGDDCDDVVYEINVGAAEEWYNGIDQDCDGLSDFDQDHDGFDYDVYGGDDCNDARATVNPGVNEDCDTTWDDNCDGGDTDLLNAEHCTVFFYDGDNDGYGSPTVATQCWCEPQTAAHWDEDDANDCNDSRADVSPADPEVCDGSNVDEDCDGVADDSDGSTASAGKTRYYPDADGDEYGDEDNAGTLYCDDPSTASVEWHTSNTDCDDLASAINPAAQEVCDATNTDEDCDDTADNADASALAAGKTLFYPDDDHDAYGDKTDPGTSYCDNPSTSSVWWTTDKTDCDDARADVSPGDSEVCDSANTDEDCDTLADNNDSSAVDSGKTNFYVDADSDSHGSSTASANRQCDQPAGYVASKDDCDDGRAATYTGASETCNDIDDDCDGTADDGLTTYWYDGDRDGYGDNSVAKDCSYTASVGNDCSDSVAAVNPGATEICDASNTDEDCDGLADNNDTSAASAGKTTYYPDADGDEYGASSGSAAYCDDPSTASVEWHTTSTDCNDGSASINPGATEICDASNTDEDCDGLADNNDSSASASGKTNFYVDSDGDTYGSSSAAAVKYCDLPSGYSASNTDCNDASSAISPAATEICDGSNTDEDCDTLADDNDTSTASAGKSTWYRDADSDTYGTASTTLARCDQPSGYVSNDDDCNDATDAISPADAEICDGSNTDEDCDGNADDSDASATGQSTWYQDADSDGYGRNAITQSKCDQPSGYVSVGNDCSDSVAAVNPGATEVCDGSNTDEDCDGQSDDDDSSVSSGSKSSWYADVDNDGYGDASDATATLSCDEPTAGGAASHDDCDDAVATTHPGASDPIGGDLFDNDCDDLVDEDGVAAGTLVISEFFTAGTADYDWFEVYNPNAYDVAVDGWELDLCYEAGNNTSTVPWAMSASACDILETVILDPFEVPAGEHVVFCQISTPANLTWTTPADCDYTLDYADITGLGGLSGDVGGIGLYVTDSTTVTVDVVTWWQESGTDDWPTDASASVQFDSADLAGANPQNVNDDYTSGATDDLWCVYGGSTSWATGYTGTPGAANTTCP